MLIIIGFFVFVVGDDFLCNLIKEMVLEFLEVIIENFFCFVFLLFSNIRFYLRVN